MSLHDALAIVWVGSALTLAFGAYHCIALYMALERARAMGLISARVKTRFLDIDWLFDSAGLVPYGLWHRKMIIRALVTFCVLWLIFGILMDIAAPRS